MLLQVHILLVFLVEPDGKAGDAAVTPAAVVAVRAMPVTAVKEEVLAGQSAQGLVEVAAADGVAAAVASDSTAKVLMVKPQLLRITVPGVVDRVARAGTTGHNHAQPMEHLMAQKQRGITEVISVAVPAMEKLAQVVVVAFALCIA